LNASDTMIIGANVQWVGNGEPKGSSTGIGTSKGGKKSSEKNDTVSKQFKSHGEPSICNVV
jgi:hypothetical protein